MLNRLKIMLYLCFIVCFFLSQKGLAYNDGALEISLLCDNIFPVSGEEFTVSLNFSVANEPINISAYRLKVKFDSSKLTYKGLYSYTNNDDFESYTDGNNLTILYVTSERGIDLSIGESKIVLELNFKVLSNCEVGTNSISAVIDGICNYEAEAIPLPEIDPVTINVAQSGEGNCDLAVLSTAEYKLSPVFSSDITKYSVEVPYSKSTMEFEAIPLDQEATVKANRKTLKSAGTTTDINLTVTSADKKSKKVYTVTVNRLSKNASNDAEHDKYTDINALDESISTNDNKNDTDELFDKDIAQNNSVELQNSSAPLVIKENSFNFILFFAATIILTILCIFIIKQKNILSK